MSGKALWLLAALLGPEARGAVTIDLGAARTYGVLANTYTGLGISSKVEGDFGYVSLLGVPPTVTGTTRTGGADAQARLDQAAALATLNGMACTYTFPTGAVDLAGGTPVVYTPGVYCGDAAMAIAGGATITLSGYGVYVFRTVGALDTSAGSRVVLTGGALARDVYWTPSGATTLGAGSEFVGTVISGAAITLGTTVSWTGRALAANAAVTFDSDQLTVFVERLSVSIASASTYNFAAVAAGSVNVSGTSFDILNDGNVPEVFLLSVADPAPWVSEVSGSPSAMNRYELDAQFNHPAAPAGWTPAAHALTASAVPSSLSRFAGDEDAAFVDSGGHRHLWVRFHAPALTDQVGARAMVVTIAAQVP